MVDCEIAMLSPDDFEWMSPWHPITSGDAHLLRQRGEISLDPPEDGTVAKSLEDELMREIPEGHPLSGLKVRAIGYCSADPNEFLYLTSSPEHPIACVHLTWQTEADPRWPHTDLYASASDWTSQMLREYEGAKTQRAEQGGAVKRGWRRWLASLWRR